MTVYWPEGEENPNMVALRNIFGDEVVDTVDPAPCSALGGTGSGYLSLSLIAMTTAFLALLKPW